MQKAGFIINFENDLKEINIDAFVGTGKIINLDNFVVDDTIKVKALIDTGANSSVISNDIAKTLNLKNIGVTEVSSVNKTENRPIYEADLFLSWGVEFRKVALIGMDFVDDTQLILGMDLLTKYKYDISNSSGKTVFKFIQK